MFQAYCSQCDDSWENDSPNCPDCGTDNPSAERIGGQPKTRLKKPMKPGTESTFMSSATKAMKQGAALAAANEANNVIKTGAAKALLAAGLSQEAIDSPAFQKGMPALVALVTLFVAEKYPGVIPKSDMVVKAAGLALTSASAEALEPLLGHAMPMLTALASAGEKLGELEGDVYEEEEVDEGEDYVDADFETQEPEIEVTPSDRKRSGVGVSPDNARRPNS